MSNTRTARPRTTTKPKVSLDLDTLEREGQPEEPFVTRLGGKEFTFSDPMETEWQDLVVISPQDTVAFLRALLGDQYADFAKHRMPFWKLAHLTRSVQEYYGMLNPEGIASPTS
jgi:hypothetical protein